MELLTDLLLKMSAPFLYPFAPNQRIHLLYLSTALLLAFLVYNAGSLSRGGSVLRAYKVEVRVTHTP